MVRSNQNHLLSMVWKKIWKSFEEKSIFTFSIFNFISLSVCFLEIASFVTFEWRPLVRRLENRSNVIAITVYTEPQKLGKFQIFDFVILHFQLLVNSKKGFP